MNLKWMGPLIGLSVLGGTSVANAQGEDLLSCLNRGFILQKCVLEQTQIAAPGLDRGEPFETEYAVTYDFPCRGSAVNVGVQTGSDFEAFRMGAVGETLTAIGKEPLVTSDPDPERTLKLGFRPGCYLVVRNVTALPSNNTIALWTSEAKSEARILAMARDLYLLSKNFVSIASFDRTQLGVVIDATQARVDAATNALDRRRWRSLLDSLVAMRDAQPLPVPKADVDAYLADLAADARTALLTEADTARAMADRFTTWSVEVEKTLHDVLDSIPAT